MTSTSALFFPILRRLWALDNYLRVITDPAFQKAVGDSLIFTVGSLYLPVCDRLCAGAAVQPSFPGNGLLRALLLLGWMLPSVVSGSIFRWMFDGGMGIINYALQVMGLLETPRFWLNDANTALAATIIANIWVGIPFNMILLLPGLQSIPRVVLRGGQRSTEPTAGRASATSRCR